MATIKEALTAKITTAEEYFNLLKAFGHNRILLNDSLPKNRMPNVQDTYVDGGYRAYAVAPGTGFYERGLGASFRGISHKEKSFMPIDSRRWWMHREHMRLWTGVYELPAVLDIVFRGVPELALHVRPEVSAEDPSAVFYTPDVQAGERDQQVRTTLGRFVRKYYPQVSDDAARDLDAALRAEMSMELEIIGPEGIAENYVKGPHSCMAHPLEKFNLRRYKTGELVHPTEAYNAPGFGLAVGRDGSGKINARSLVWVNPHDPKDKRWVRLYGDQALLRRLEKHGYKSAGLSGALIRRIRLESSDPETHRIALPYLDTTAEREHGRFVVVEDDEFLRVISDEDYTDLRNMGFIVTSAQNSSGVTVLDTKPRLSMTNGTCPVTGRAVRGRELQHTFLAEDGTVKRATLEGASLLESRGYKYVQRVEAGKSVHLYVPPTAPLFSWRGYMWLDEESSRVHAGFHKLSPMYYPDFTGWYEGRVTAVHPLEGDPYERESTDMLTVKADDVVQVVRYSARHNLVRALPHHVSVISGPVRKVQRVSADTPLYAGPEVKVEVTPGGKHVVEGIHPVVRMFDGRLEYQRNTRSARLISGTIAYAPRISDKDDGSSFRDWIKAENARFKAEQIALAWSELDDRVKFHGGNILDPTVVLRLKQQVLVELLHVPEFGLGNGTFVSAHSTDGRVLIEGEYMYRYDRGESRVVSKVFGIRKLPRQELIEASVARTGEYNRHALTALLGLADYVEDEFNARYGELIALRSGVPQPTAAAVSDGPVPRAPSVTEAAQAAAQEAVLMASRALAEATTAIPA